MEGTFREIGPRNPVKNVYDAKEQKALQTCQTCPGHV